MSRKEPLQTYGSEALASVHETLSDLHGLGLVSPETTPEFDGLCLTAVTPMTPEEIQALRTTARMSQAVFVRELNVSTSLVSQWERGERTASGPSLKLLSLIRAEGICAVA